ncbi:MAG: MBL fold metallo-hydrolase [archaeon]|nr:MBL fold metallo-hydrolase [archaeon]
MKIEGTEGLYWYFKNKPVQQLFLRGLSCNVFAIDQGDEIWLIDSGVEILGRVKRILKWMKKDGLDPERITKIFITHAHIDHFNGVNAFRKLVNSNDPNKRPEVFVHEVDENLFNGSFEMYFTDQVDYMKQNYDLGDKIFPISMKQMRRIMAYTMGNDIPNEPPDGLLKDGEVVKGSRYDLKVIHTPNHSEGHCCFYIPQEKAMFIGDIIDPHFDHKSGINSFTADFEVFINSTKKLLEYEIEYFCGAHAEKIHVGIQHNKDLINGVLKNLDFARERTIEVLNKNNAIGTEIKDFMKELPSSIWQFEKVHVGFAAIKSLEKEGKIKQEGNKFFLIEN